MSIFVAFGIASDLFYEFNFVLRKWRKIEPKGEPPPVSSDHCAVVYKNQMFVYGGRGHASKRNNIPTGIPQPIYDHMFRFDFKTETWDLISQRSKANKYPAPRKAFGYQKIDHLLYIWSGWDNRQFFRDMWTFDLNEFVWNEIGFFSL